MKKDDQRNFQQDQKHRQNQLGCKIKNVVRRGKTGEIILVIGISNVIQLINSNKIMRIHKRNKVRTIRTRT